MERLDFASVMAVLRRNIPDENFTNQADFLYSLFVDMDCGTDDIIDFYSGQACRWFNGVARLSPSIIRFYQQESNKEKLRYRIQSEVLPIMPDSAMAAQELYDLVLHSTNVSPPKKM